jgi:hypothetical protein
MARPLQQGGGSKTVTQDFAALNPGCMAFRSRQDRSGDARRRHPAVSFCGYLAGAHLATMVKPSTGCPNTAAAAVQARSEGKVRTVI